jgi:RNA polymerase sigma-70 factor (ECF subfamily)
MSGMALDRQITRPATSSPRPDTSHGVFRELAMPLFDSLYNFAHWLTRNREEAEDLVQETYVKALRGFNSFQPGTNFRAWIFQILRNTFATSRSKRALSMAAPFHAEDDLSTIPSNSSTAESLLIRYSDLHLVRCALEELPPLLQEVMLLCDVEEMSYQETAQALSIPIGTVMSRLARARRAVRAALGKTPGAIPCSSA